MIAAFKEKGDAQLNEAVQGNPSAGYIWTDETLGYTLRYAFRQTLPNGGERIVLLTDRRLGSWSGLRTDLIDRFWRAGVDYSADPEFVLSLAHTGNKPLYGWLRRNRSDHRLQDALDVALVEAVMEDKERPVHLLVWAGADSHRRVPTARELGRPITTSGSCFWSAGIERERAPSSRQQKRAAFRSTPVLGRRSPEGTLIRT